jgi:hypothetical protein
MKMKDEEAVQVTISISRSLARLIEDHLQPYGFGGFSSLEEYVEACVKLQVQADLDNLYSDREEVLKRYGISKEQLEP